MSKQHVVWIALALAACKGKGNEADPNAKPATPPAPATCPGGQVVKDGACIVVVTPEKVAAVAQQQTKIDELAKLLDQVDTAAAPVDLLNGLRGLAEWKALVLTNDKAKLADDTVATLVNAIATLRAFKANLGEVSVRLGNLKGELDKLLTSTGAAQQLADVRTAISAQTKAVLDPFAAQVTDTIQHALVPLSDQLDKMSAIVDIACGTVKLSGGDQAKALCKDARTVFDKGVAYVADFKARPAALYAQVSGTLETQLDQLIDTTVKQGIDAAQVQVNKALELPAAGSAAPAAGSAAPAAGSAN